MSHKYVGRVGRPKKREDIIRSQETDRGVLEKLPYKTPTKRDMVDRDSEVDVLRGAIRKVADDFIATSTQGLISEELKNREDPYRITISGSLNRDKTIEAYTVTPYLADDGGMFFPASPQKPVLVSYVDNTTTRKTISGYIMTENDRPSEFRGDNILIKHPSGSYISFEPDGTILINAFKIILDGAIIKLGGDGASNPVAAITDEVVIPSCAAGGNKGQIIPKGRPTVMI
jgi:hypothetical protein